MSRLVTQFTCEYSISDMTMTPDNHLCVAEEESCVSKYTLTGLCVGRLKLSDCYLGGICCLQTSSASDNLPTSNDDFGFSNPGILAVPTSWCNPSGRVLVLDGSSGDQFGVVRDEVDTAENTYWSVCDLGVDRGLVLARQGHVATTTSDNRIKVPVTKNSESNASNSLI